MANIRIGWWFVSTPDIGLANHLCIGESMIVIAHQSGRIELEMRTDKEEKTWRTPE
jgi:hypothetical protein